MKKKLLFALCIIILMVSCLSCAEKSFPSDLYIVAEDVKNVPDGEYSLIYSINKYDTYESKYYLDLSVNVYEKNTNLALNVKNNRTVTLETDNLYTVVIQVTGMVDNESKVLTAQYEIETEKSDRHVTFMHSNTDIVEVFVVPYGGTIDYEEIPYLPDVYPATTVVGYTEIVSKKWVVIDSKGNSNELTQEHLSNIVVDMPVYSEYKYETHPIKCTVKFDTDGGSAIPDYVGDSDTIMPIQPTPIKEGYTFMGWCDDKERKIFHNWRAYKKLVRNTTLYAKFVKNTENATSNSNFNFVKKEDSNGNGYYVIEAKDKENLSGELILPNNYNGLPVKEFAGEAFFRTEISSVYIPNTYLLNASDIFMECEELSSVVFEKGNMTTNISPSCFRRCFNLTEIDIPDTVTHIRENAFSECLSLKNVSLPQSLVFITERAFYGCKGLMKIELPNTTEYLMEKCFATCDKLTEFVVNENSRIYSISSDTFEESGVKEITLPFSIKESKPLADSGITVTYYPEEIEEAE